MNNRRGEMLGLLLYSLDFIGCFIFPGRSARMEKNYHSVMI